MSEPANLSDPGAEKWLLGAMLNDPRRFDPQKDGITPEHFRTPGYRLLYQHLLDRIERGDLTADHRELADHLPQNVRNNLGEHWEADLVSIRTGYDGDSSRWPHRVRHLKVASERRRLHREGELMISTALTGTPEELPGVEAHAGLLDRAYQLRFDPEQEPPPEEVCLTIGDYPIAARGNLTIIQGKSKVGKSATIAAVLGAAQRGRYAAKGDTLKMEWVTASSGAIIHLDTEQSPSDWHALVSRSVTRSGLPEVSPRLVSLPLVRFQRSERLAILEQALEKETIDKGGIDLVVVDGVADLCLSPNDEAESLELVSRLLALSHEFSTNIVCVLHENPSTDLGKTRGHLGSELNRKAFANLRIDRDGELSTIYGTEMRKRSIPKEQGFCFGWDDEAGMHIFQGRSAGIKAAMAEDKARHELRDEIEPAWNLGNFPQFPLARHGELVAAIGEYGGNGKSTKPDAIKKRVTKAETLGIITKTEAGFYRLNPEGNLGN